MQRRDCLEPKLLSQQIRSSLSCTELVLAATALVRYARIVLFFHSEKAARVLRPQRVTRAPLRTLDRWKASQCHPPSFLR